jgi:hypothetical protein
LNERPTILGIVVAITIGLLLLLFAAEGILRIAMPNWQEFHNGRFMRVLHVPNHGLVTTGRPGFDGYFSQNNGDFRVRVQINNFGYRNPEPVERAKGRIWFVGDSMAFGWGVKQNEMYSTVVGSLLNFPTYNVASPGTNVCGYQALLARTLDRARPRAVIAGLILENDLAVYNCRKDAVKIPANVIQPQSDHIMINVNRLKILLMQKSALYNFLVASIKRVAFINKALIRIGLIAKVHAFKPANTMAGFVEVLSRTAEELKNLKAQIPADIPFAVLIAPARFEIRDRDPAYQRVREGMVRELAERGIDVIDPIDKFFSAGFQLTHFAHDGHWSAFGHKIAAQAAADWLHHQKIGK